MDYLEDVDNVSLRKARFLLGLTQQALADIFGVTQLTYQCWENGKRGDPGRRAKMSLAFMLWQDGRDWREATEQPAAAVDAEELLAIDEEDSLV